MRFRKHLSRWLTDYRRNAFRKNLQWGLSLDEFKQLVFSDCYYCGKPPTRKKFRARGRVFSSFEKLNGIDRADNSLGYVADNCVPCCKLCNAFKADRLTEVFLKHAARIAGHKRVA